MNIEQPVPRSSRSEAPPAEEVGPAAAYLGQQGVRYFAYQQRIGEVGGKLDARKFQPFIRPDAAVLDFGCGGGYLLRALDCGRRIGVEPNDTARRVCIDAGIECHGSIAKIGDAEVDIVVSNHALEHVPSPIAALRECRRVLRATGRLVLCVPIDDWRTQKRYISGEPNHHLHTWTPQLLGNTLVEAGFQFASSDIRILAEAWPPGVETLIRVLPDPALTISMRVWATLSRRRQILAVATPES